MRRLAMLLALAAAAVPTAAAADAVTTRIETRPYYGAIVTLEQGVRVWRALPPHDRIIIVPERLGKVNINVDAGRRSHAPAPMVNNVNINQHGPAYQDGVVGLPYGGYLRRPPHRPGPHHDSGGHGGRTGGIAPPRH